MRNFCSRNRLNQCTSGEYVFHVPTGEVHRFQSIDAAYDEAAGLLHGTVTVTLVGGESEMVQDATAVDADLRTGDIVPLPPRIVDDPEGVLLAFARQEITRYTNRLSDGHDYNGIDGVEIVAHLRAASYLAAQGKPAN